MYMINYKNTYRRKATLMQRFTAFVNDLVSGKE